MYYTATPFIPNFPFYWEPGMGTAYKFDHLRQGQDLKTLSYTDCTRGVWPNCALRMAKFG